MMLKGKPVRSQKRYKVASWAPVSGESDAIVGEPIWEVIARYLRDLKTIAPPEPNVPKLIGAEGNPGLA